MYRKVLVPLDGSKTAECTFDHILAIATGCSVPEVDLIFVSEPPPPMESVPYERILAEMQNFRLRMKEYLDTAANNLKQKGVVSTKTVVTEGNAADTIIKYAADNGVDLILMSTHGRSGPSRWAFGSVAEKVVRYSNVPVFIVAPRGCRLPVTWKNSNPAF